MMVGALTDPFDTIHMGVTAENVATKCGITREQQDAFAVESHQRAAAATAAGHFKSQILPIELKSKKGPIAVRHRRARARATRRSKAWPSCKAVFAKENGTVTAGNASGINDAAAAVVLMERSGGSEEGPEADGAAGRLRPRRRRSQDHGPRPGHAPSSARSRRRASSSTTSTSSNRTKRSPRRRSA